MSVHACLAGLAAPCCACVLAGLGYFLPSASRLKGSPTTHDSMTLTPAYVPNWFLSPGKAEPTVHITRVVLRAQIQVPVFGSASAPDFLFGRGLDRGKHDPAALLIANRPVPFLMRADNP